MDKSYISSSIEIYALVITYNPSIGFNQHLENLLKTFNHIILVDNGSSTDIQAMLKTQAQNKKDAITILLNQKNLGIATALNQGLEYAIHKGYEHIITLDQDSLPTLGMAKTLIDGFQSHPNRDKLAILAPQVVEEIVIIPPRHLRSKKSYFFERVTCEETFLRNV